MLICGGCSRLQSDAAVSEQGQQPSVSVSESVLTIAEQEKTEEHMAEQKEMESDIAKIETETSDMQGTEEQLSVASENSEAEVEQYLASMTLEEKIAQLFIVLPESLIEGVDCVTAAGETTRKAISSIPVGGFIYFSGNLRSEEQVKTMLSNTQAYSMERTGLSMFLCVDEEGGTVTRVSGTGKFQTPVIGDMRDIGATKETENAYKTGAEIGGYLFRMGFNVDFAPVADVLSNPDNQVVRRRSFGEDPENVSQMCLSFSEGLRSQGILGCYKHFPGHGATVGDTHKGYAYTEKALEELKACELVPFQKAIQQGGIPFIMIGHLSLPGVIGDDTPASLSSAIITDLLRKDMGYDGIVITDAMNMGAIVQQYSPADGAVRALQAGADIILMPADFKAAYNGVLQAVKSGELSLERIDESLRRILRVKLNMK